MRAHSYMTACLAHTGCEGDREGGGGIGVASEESKVMLWTWRAHVQPSCASRAARAPRTPLSDYSGLLGILLLGVLEPWG